MATIAGPRERARIQRALRERLGRQILELRTDAGVSGPDLARCAGMDPGHLWRIEAGAANPSLRAIVSIASCLGTEPSLRLFPVGGPRLHDRFQAPMIEALIAALPPSWRAEPEVPVPAARGVIDLVLRRPSDHLVIACECHSELRRLELVLRRLAEKAEAVRGHAEVGEIVSTMLFIRSTEATRAVARAYEATLKAAFPARSRDALEALAGDAPWPGAAIVWARVEAGRAILLDGPPRGVRVGQ